MTSAYRPEQPLIVQADRSLLLEVDNPRFAECRDRLAAFAELRKSPEHIHSYGITPLSLWNACSAGLSVDRVIETLVEFSKYAIPAMRRAGGGSIVNISSVAGIGQSLHQEPAYAASKGAIRIFTKVTASQHAKDKIRCNSVHPGPVDTEMFHSAFQGDREAMEKRLQRVPLRRMGTVPEIVSAVLYLASDDSSYITGSELVVDGGALAQ